MSESKHKAVYVIVENNRLQKPLFRRIGTAFVNKDQSLNVVLEALPMKVGCIFANPGLMRIKVLGHEENSPCLRRFNGATSAVRVDRRRPDPKSEKTCLD